MAADISQPDRHWHRWRWVLLVVLVAALALRLGWVIRLPADDGSLARLPDQLEYLELGRNLLEGRGLVFYHDRFGDELRAYRTPGYPLFIAMLRADVRAIRLAQVLVDVLTVLGAYVLARRWLGQPASVLAGALVAFNPFLVFFAGLILTETLFTSMLVWGMALLVLGGRPQDDAQRAPRRGAAIAWWAGAGVLALSVLVRPSALALPVVLAVVAAVANRGTAGPYLWRWAPPVATTVLVLQMAVLLPWGYRNHRVLGAWVFTTTNSGITLYDGFNPDATGASDQRFIRFMPQLRPMGELERSEYLSNLAWQYVRTHPRRAVELGFIKIARTWSPVPLSDDYGTRRNVIAGAAYMIPLLLLVIAGLVIGRLSKSAKVFLLMPAIYFTAAHAMSVGSLRYRVPADVPMAVIAAAGLVAAAQSIRSRPASQRADPTG